MSKRLLRRTEEWAADTEQEINEILTDSLDDGGDLTKKTIEVKQRKSKGEVIEEHKKVTVQVTYDIIWETEGKE